MKPKKKLTKTEKVKKTLSSSKSVLKNFKLSLKLYWKISPSAMMSTLIPLVIATLIPFATSYIYARLIDSAISFIGGGHVERDYVIKLLVINLSLLLIGEIMWKMEDFGEKMTFQRWNVYCSGAFNEAMSKLDLEIYENNKFNKFINKVRDGYEWKPADYIMRVTWAFIYTMQLGASIVFMVTLSPYLIPLLFFALMPEFILSIRSRKEQWGIWDLKGDEKINYFNTISYLNGEGYIKELRIFNTRDYLVQLMRKVLSDFINAQNKIIKKEAISTTLAKIPDFAARAGISIWLVSRVLQKNGFSIGDFTFFSSTVERFSSSSRQLLRQIGLVYERDLYMTEYFKLMNMESKVATKPDALVIDSTKVPTIEFRNVTFGYPGSEEKVFKDFSLKINPGEDIALVGENGAGKTTFVKLLSRFYDVEEGQILINGIDIRDVDLNSWYKNIGVLFQDFNKYAYSVKDNIGLGNVSQMSDIDKIIKSGKESGADEFVKDYKKGYERMLSKQFSGGTEPSGGQWQKIALARAFFRDSNILILDEPTSAIDAKAEYEIFEKIAKMQKEKTTIIISHRFSTVKKADKIYVIDKGRIIEHGGHKDLIAIENGIYKKMFELQAEGYK